MACNMKTVNLGNFSCNKELAWRKLSRLWSYIFRDETPCNVYSFLTQHSKTFLQNFNFLTEKILFHAKAGDTKLRLLLTKIAWSTFHGKHLNAPWKPKTYQEKSFFVLRRQCFPLHRECYNRLLSIVETRNIKLLKTVEMEKKLSSLLNFQCLRQVNCKTLGIISRHK